MDKSLFCSIPANLVFNDLIICSFIVQIPWSSSSFSHDWSNAWILGITTERVAVALEIDFVTSSTGESTITILFASSNYAGVSCAILFSAEYAARAIFCSKIYSTMYKVEFHLVDTSCFNLCWGRFRFSGIWASLWHATLECLKWPTGVCNRPANCN